MKLKRWRLNKFENSVARCLPTGRRPSNSKPAIKREPLGPRASSTLKKVVWFTTFGRLEVQEQLLRLGRRGPELRPFCESAGVRPRGYSQRLQRVVVDFGAEHSFGQAAQRVAEHYGIQVPVEAVRQYTLRHGRSINPLAAGALAPAKALVVQMDGSMIPVVQ